LGEHLVYTEKVAGSSPAPPIAAFPAHQPFSDCATPVRVYERRASQPWKEGMLMLWLIAGVVLLIIAIAGGAIVHPVLFALAIVALLIFFMGRGGRRTTV
jgi:hypothetical protein